jgi:UDP-N-acetylglucosamine 1-carboxyvinyltransferase
MRASFYVAAPLLARLQKAEVPLPGGCVLGARPINYHVEAFQKMGANISVVHWRDECRSALLARREHLSGAEELSVGATVNIMMAAAWRTVPRPSRTPRANRKS